MDTKGLINQWFACWENGNYKAIPVTDDFVHTSPLGRIVGKKEYLELVDTNSCDFLGHHFIIHESLIGENNACVRYTSVTEEFRQEVSEWYHFENGLIKEIYTYYDA